jgi:hypothetical protein
MPCCRDAALLGRSGFSTATPVGAFCTPIASNPREAGRSIGKQKWRRAAALVIGNVRKGSGASWTRRK